MSIAIVVTHLPLICHSSMNLALQIGDSQIPCDRVLQKLYDAQLLPQLLREMVIDELIERVAGEYQIDLTPTPAEFERLSEQVSEIAPFQGMNAVQIEAITLRTLKLHKFKQAGWGHKVSSYYQTVQHQLYRVSYSILQVEDGLLAQEIFFRIQSGEQSFAELAVQYSQDASAKKGGLVGPILSRELPPAIGQVLQKLSPGELSPLFQLDRNYGFIRLNDVVPPQLDENMHQVLLDELFESWIQAQIAAEVGANGEISIIPTTATIEQSPVLALADPANVHGNSPQAVDLFAPDFGYKETTLEPISSQQIEPSATPEVTVVTEPADTNLDISTGFFFPNRQKDRSLADSNLTADAATTDPASSSTNAFVLPPDPESTTPPIVQSQRRSRKLGIGIVLLTTLGITSIGVNRSISTSGNPTRFLPEPIRGWIEGISPFKSPPPNSAASPLIINAEPDPSTHTPDRSTEPIPSMSSANAFVKPHDATSRYQAILVAQKIPADAPTAAEAKQAIERWSSEIYQIAQGYANKQIWHIAIGTAKMVPPQTSSYNTAQTSMVEWRSKLGN
jgi:parvulin-like peptidyl-prolyl isomerase